MAEMGRLLIVDDEKRGREALDLLLGAEGYQIEFAEDGQQAIVKASEFTPDLILLDVMMPMMDGIQVCRQLRANPKLGEVPIILLTALDDRELRLQGIEAGADDYIAKPFDRLELRARIRTIIRLNRYRTLQAERGKFEWVVERAEDGYLLTDEQGKISYANERAIHLLHLSPASGEDWIGKNFLSLAASHYNLEPQEGWLQWPYSPDALPHYLVRPESAMQRALWLQVDCHSVPSPTAVSILVRLRDVSEKMNLQQQSWTFHRLVSHKLRTPLMGLTALQLARRQIGALEIDPKLLQLLDMAVQNVERLQQQIMDVLQYVDAPDLLAGGMSASTANLPHLAAIAAQESGVEMRFLAIPDTPPARLNISDAAIKTILQELFCNSKKFHPEHKPLVELELRNTSLELVMLRVSDNGRHILPTELQKVWMPYYQSERRFTGEVIGMGLGLSTVASLIWGIGGNCRMFNREEQSGVVVELILPLFKFPTPANVPKA